MSALPMGQSMGKVPRSLEGWDTGISGFVSGVGVLAPVRQGCSAGSLTFSVLLILAAPSWNCSPSYCAW